MRVLFLYPIPPPHLQEIGFQQGIGSLSAVLKQHGHETRLEAFYELDNGTLGAAVEDFGPDVVGLSVTYNQFQLASRAVTAMRRRWNFPILLGGVHPSTCPEECIALEGVSVVCLGESETAMVELLARMTSGDDWRSVPGTWVKTADDIIKNPVRPWVADLDALPFPDRELFDACQLMRRRDRLEVICSRGCNFSCSNCFHHAWRRRHAPGAGYVRYRSPERVVQEISEALAARPGVRIIQFHDADLPANLPWLRRFTPLYAREIRIPFACNARATSLDEEGAELLKSANCSRLHVGVESGSEFIRNKILRKQVSDDQLVRAFSSARRHGIFTLAFNMIGLPHETPATVRKTIRLNRRLRANVVFASVFLPFPGTDLYDVCQKEGWITDRHVRSYFEHRSVLEQPTIRGNEVAYYHRIFPWAVKYPWLTPFIAPTIKIPWPGGRRLYDVAIEPMYQKGFRLYRRIRNWLRRRSIRSGGAGNS